MSIVVMLYFLLLMALLLTSRNEPLLFLRLAFLGSPGVICALALWNGYIVSLHLPMAQTPEFLRQAIVLNAIGLISARLGWVGGVALSRRVPQPKSMYILNDISVKNLIFLFFIVIVAWFAEGKGASIAGKAYAVRDGSGLPLGNFNAIINILLAVILYFYFSDKNFKYMWHTIIFILAYKVFYANLFRGIRADALDTVVMIFILLSVYKPNFSKIRIKYIIIGLIFLVMLQIVGKIRSSFIEHGFDDIWNMTLLAEIGGAKMLNISTIGPITATYLGFIYLADTGYTLPLLRTYLGWILRIPPEFIYPGRPQDIALVFREQGLTSGGGSFELGEAYVTLGIAGVMIVPAVVSAVFAFLISRLRRFPRSIVLFVVLASLLAVFSRGAWYQTFAYFKSFVTGIILLIPILFMARSVRLARPIFIRGGFPVWSRGRPVMAAKRPEGRLPDD